MKKIISIITFLLLMTICFGVTAADLNSLTAQSAILATGDGEILFEKNPDERFPQASITKITTALLVMEAIDDGKITMDDTVIVSENAAIKKGSHIFLAQGERITVHELMKGLMVSSGNDAAIALAEHVSGTEEEFVKAMNKRAKELGMTNTNYANSNGLDASNHYSSAKDIVTVTKELLKHEKIFEYSTIWMDTLRNGAFQLANTNKLIRFYDGANGMKTGYTSGAGYCVSATAKRNNMQLIAVVLNAPSTQDRFSDASTMLNFGFNTYENEEVLKKDAVAFEIDVNKGKKETVPAIFEKDYSTIVKKGEKINYKIEKPTDIINAPVEKGQKVGEAKIYNGETEIGKVDIVISEKVEKLSFLDIIKKLFMSFFEFLF